MKSLDAFLDATRNIVRHYMKAVAKFLNSVSGGQISPNTITMISLIMHVPIAYLISQGELVSAGLLLIVFGLFDTLDGELARLQKRDGNLGMLLDASTDRMKEVLLYAGISYLLVREDSIYAVWAIIAVGGSLIVSYVKAKGETALKDSDLKPNQINRVFQDGLMRFEVRMAAIVAGLLFNILGPIVIALAVLSWATAFERLIKISHVLR